MLIDSPQPLHTIRVQRMALADGHLLCSRLCHQQPVERILMVERQRRQMAGVPWLDRQYRKVIAGDARSMRTSS